MKRKFLKHNGEAIHAEIHLTGSKSISNRVLIIRALSGGNFDIENLSESEDSKVLLKMLEQKEDEYNAGHAGTSFRFMTAYLALKDGVQVLAGSERMHKRPIGPLVQALNDLGCNIEYLDKEGFPPLKISAPKPITGGEVEISGSISSQFLSAIILVAPYMTQDVDIKIKGELVSKPYLQMTIELVRKFGANIEFAESNIRILTGNYISEDFYVEADWSSASYLYEIAAISNSAEITIKGLMQHSFQGDSRMAAFALDFGVQTQFETNQIVISKVPEFDKKEILEFNLIEQPDLCQTLVCMCAATGTQGLFSGLKTLHIKETDRIQALNTELAKFGVYFSALPKTLSGKSDETYYMLNGQITSAGDRLSIETYDDHRMAMAFAPLSQIREIEILDPEVVKKSYPNYWEDLLTLGFILVDKA